MPAEILDRGRNAQRLDVGELTNMVMVTPSEEPANCMQVGSACVPVAGWWRQ